MLEKIEDQLDHYLEHGRWPGYAPCVGSGMCCKKVPCAFGQWDEAKHQCAYLIEQVEGDVAIYRCGEYERIRQLPSADFNPAFGAGCCMNLFNENRQRILLHLLARRKR